MKFKEGDVVVNRWDLVNGQSEEFTEIVIDNYEYDYDEEGEEDNYYLIYPSNGPGGIHQKLYKMDMDILDEDYILNTEENRRNLLLEHLLD